MTAINSRPVLVTGAAGFIGAALCQRLLQRGDRVIGIDNYGGWVDGRQVHPLRYTNHPNSSRRARELSSRARADGNHWLGSRQRGPAQRPRA